MATRRRLTDDELFKLADEAHDRWGTVTVSALQHAAGGGSAARFKKIIAEWDRRRDKGAPEEPPEEFDDTPEPPPDDTATAAATDRRSGAERNSRTAYDRLLDELHETRRAHAAETARLNRLIDALLDELRARREAVPD
jgi:Plasmid replication region DNA-binding N-term